MISRFALVGLAVATLAGPVAAAGSSQAGAPAEVTPTAADQKPVKARTRILHAKADAAPAGPSTAQPTADAAPVTGAKPAARAKPVADAKPAAGAKPTAAAKPAAGGKPAPDGKPVADADPSPDAKPAAEPARSRHSLRKNRRAVAAAQPEVEAPAPPPIKPLFPWLMPAPTGTPAAVPTAVTPGTLPANPAANPIATSWFGTLFGAAPLVPRGQLLPALASRGQIDALVTHHARLNGVPEALVHRIIVRESKYNPRAVGRGGAMGLMQIKTGTARGVGYPGGPAGLLDAETNLTYGIKYLAGAYKAAGGNMDRAVGYYASGYYYAARRQSLAEGGTRSRRGRRQETRQEADANPPAAPEPIRSLFSFAAPGR